MTTVTPIIPARLAFAADGTPWSAAYDDIYHSADGGLGQARHVFLAGNRLLGETPRWRGRSQFVIAETGFGLGLNFLATWQAWQADGQPCQRLHYIAFEQHPFTADDLALLHARWPALAAFSAQLRAQWPRLTPGAHRLELAGGRLILTLFFGDAQLLLPKLRARVDAFYLDGFSPAKNPALWSGRIYSSLARLAAPAATMATWCVAGQVRKALADSGFLLEKTPGFGGKREMLRGVFRAPRNAAVQQTAGRAIIIGAGLAGSSIAERLAARGWQIELFDGAPAAANGASGNRSAILRPLPSPDDNLLARLTRAGFLHLRRHLEDLETRGLTVRQDACGVLHLARDAQHAATQETLVTRQQPPADYLQHLDAGAASARAGRPLPFGGWWFPQGGWVDTPSLCAANLAACGERLQCHFNTPIDRIERQGRLWQVFAADGRRLAQADVLILANANGALPLLFPHVPALPLRPARGQVSHLPAASLDGKLPACVICRLGHVGPAAAHGDDESSTFSFGASFLLEDSGTELRLADHQDNLAKLEFCLPGSLGQLAADAVNTPSGRAAVRAMTPDRLPMVGALPDCKANAANMPESDSATTLEKIPRQPGLYALLGFGARGLVWSALTAELLACRISGEPLPLEADLVAAVDPARFLLRRQRGQA
ncbi:tRNA 5-methylaminomethyl-2-thiouridine biosynthesis bifunctional protein MnmC [Includes: tRNA (mnm(5)s(2)U34)-methyltransferase; FAD-dependent cmnm(5)s(2)U34 oxidoreductase] [Sterolibacterium denitrificans]|uniref:tRNA 5-methylaminomethyl-2-thiouridine biosynthesis bifunctional protein MnmC n=1 Tax=Sterolibacterium denitrificans TaxID=157592 RepID=A0A7Z7HRF5_9PROT|nr:bifunctional tRNA (5-methylaminomethyl-2-thiouridine)(34)-methyltransferase MnmD/FAD-dependent 5-carboxymethylaminomethyl-2-thiouridine(34) oxidoreductase MnmC [Sterolibacterium denitrificans]SMB27372.1 tRNA 5-methylaminomethyl-2-thiouridine biosynthesis bifunctional protein MnmC [Includes: tRNA (mnm(5)s(2)U34)-methyltransferase; FAD-dependent cmnm(5)s(2)U34 oxidoreductase] [Sterolibacterium denitrificans]